MKWSDEKVATLRRLVDEGLSSSQIAARMTGIYKHLYTRNSIIGKLLRLKLSTHIKPRLPHNGNPARKPGSVAPLRGAKMPKFRGSGGFIAGRTWQSSKTWTDPALPDYSPSRALAISTRYKPNGPCQWINDDKSKCGKPGQGSYCADHASIVYQPRMTK